MPDPGKYMYCIVEEETSRNFASKNIGAQAAVVHSVPFKDIGAVISDSPIMKYPLISDNYLAHQRVVEEALFNDLNPLPVRFATIARDEQSILAILEKRYDEFKTHFEQMRGKRELGLKVFWEGDIAYKEIVQENRGIKELRDKITSLSSEKTYFQKIELGELVEKALSAKREQEQEMLLRSLKHICTDYRMGRIIGDKLLLNTSFLVDSAQEALFDDHVQTMAEENRGRLQIKYVGPIPPYNFVEIIIHVSELGLG